MSSANTIQLSDAEIKVLTAEIKAISSKEKVHLRPVLQALLEVIDKSPEISLLLHKWISQTQTVRKINASDTSVPEIKKIFNLGEEERWSLMEDGLVEVPSILKRNLRDLKEALYDDGPEATCRIAVDIILVQCRKYLLNKHRSAETSHNTKTTITDVIDPSTPVVNKRAVKPTTSVKLFPEASLFVEMCDPSVPDRKILVTGRVDWAFGYSIDGDKGALLVAIEAKQISEFSKGQAQLITHLAILRENRLQAKKTNVITQGFYSDGSQYAFICITADGTINRSKTFDIDFSSDLKMVFNFIITMMETAMKSTPNALPTKPGQLQKKEVDQFEDKVWLKAFKYVEESIIVDSDDDMEDVIDIS